jgi:hypothetical protein
MGVGPSVEIEILNWGLDWLAPSAARIVHGCATASGSPSLDQHLDGL